MKFLPSVFSLLCGLGPHLQKIPYDVGQHHLNGLVDGKESSVVALSDQRRVRFDDASDRVEGRFVVWPRRANESRPLWYATCLSGA
jgi:hypothetical protein